ncbi:thiol-disulfide oxidoreductase DCC family protein [Ralstonia solanacearum]|uniref:DUF393 domain-containing protein n=2 Tax=Ralstonia solanacearum TaxID=305 RepID=A0A5H2PT07_RALSL|nr:DUF393 domain-containing protein [Ralstonia solanacearum]AEG70865.1 conserved protein of unknown function, thiol-disulfide oxidoreductase dcc domain protein [Ralstonia solanacearum Po82]AMP72265.1 thiol-disulfide oxidoreductase [Ralstonia solanacearum]AMP76864.1 thiol-disulfide oxidoreductase [Ralstonia solanacearum]AYB62349.1 DUF393 domain-containing protein [Ralstonia solanacearum]EUJ13235.1 thiol-disulfide oxidoreductase [Ralstonia solanacearum P673]
MAIIPFSHRDDPAVPAFPDDGHVVFMDGHCGACSRAARLIARLDRRDEFRICPAGSPLGRSVLIHYGLDPDDPESWLYLECGLPRFSLDAIIRVGRRLGGRGHLLAILSLIPPSNGDKLYRWIARNRYRFMGHADMCALPDPDLSRRLIG